MDTGEAIVVLGGACGVLNPAQPFPTLGLDSYSRTIYAAKLYRSRPSRPLLVTGSKCAPAMGQLLESQGIPHADIVEEDQANNTHENSLYSSRILRSAAIHTVTLVTDPKSMLRAELCFRKDGMEVIPYLAGFGPWKFHILELIPSWQAIRSNSESLHEMLGLLLYWLRGWI